MIDLLGGRKALCALLILGLGIAATVIKGDIPVNLLQLLQVVFGAFVVGNVGEHIAKARSGEGAPAQEVVDTIEELSSQLTGLQEGVAASANLASHEAAIKHEELVSQMITANQALSAILNIAGNASGGGQPPVQQATGQAQRNRYAMSGVGSISNS